MRRRAPVRLLRALLVTATVTSLAVAGHLLGGGTLPPPLLLLGVASCVLGPVAWLAGHRLTPARMLAIVGIAQLGLHEAFTVLSAPTACSAGGHSHPVDPAAPSCLPGLAPGAGGHELTGPGLAMLGGHVLAAAVTAVLLSRAEAGLWWALEWLRPLLAPSRPPRLPLGTPRPCPPPPEPPAPVWRGLSPERGRGPPVPAGPWETGRA